ncbi:MAG: C1 family peptidase [Pseudomonadota bacterium]
MSTRAAPAGKTTRKTVRATRKVRGAPAGANLRALSAPAERQLFCSDDAFLQQDDPGYSGVPQFDWRTRGIFSPPRDQVNINACTAMAIVGVVEALHYLKTHARITLSPGFIHTCLTKSFDRVGATPREALCAAASHGIAYGFPGDYPYPANHCTTGNLYTISRRTWLAGRNSTMRVLASQGPLVADMCIDTPSFLALKPGKVYRASPTDTDLHTVVLAGFDLAKKVWIVANSYGAQWADGGFGLVAFGSGGLVDERGAWQIFL